MTIRAHFPASPWLLGLLVMVAIMFLIIPAGSIYYAAAGGTACIKCHELRPAYGLWDHSTHRNIQCKECHGTIFSTDVSFHLNNALQVWKHMRGEIPERLLVKQRDISRGLQERCAKCHAQEFAAWKAGPHATTYAAIFMKEAHNQKRQLNDQCLQCHGLYFEGSIRDLVAPLDSKGPWHWQAKPALLNEPAIPCLACHTIHRAGQPLAARYPTMAPATPSTPMASREAAPPEAHRPSLAFYDRREQMHFSVDSLPLPALRNGDRKVTVAPDPKQALCYQCHAPDHTMQAGSGDDRTCLGVHEGISCLACHQKHQQSTAGSCAACHPRLSNCGLDVEKMDTTFKAKTSLHNIHFVKCLDCHPGGVPKKKDKLAATDLPPGIKLARP